MDEIGLILEELEKLKALVASVYSERLKKGRTKPTMSELAEEAEGAIEEEMMEE